MSDRGTASAGDATPGVVSGPEPGAGASVAGPGAAAAASSPEGSGSQDYLGRVRAGGDFAAQEVTSHQSRADKAVAEKKALEEWQAKLGRFQADDPAVIQTSLDEYVAWKTDPNIQKMIEKIQSGGSPSPDGDGDDEFLTDEQKEVRGLRAELAEAKQRITGTELSFGQQALTGHIEKVARDFHFTQEMFDGATATMKRNLGEWSAKANRGDKAAAEAIRNIQGPGGLKMVKSLMFADIDPEPLLDAQKNRDRRKSEGLAGLATDGQPGQASTGRETPPDFSKSANIAIDAAKFAESVGPDGHDSY